MQVFIVILVVTFCIVSAGEAQTFYPHYTEHKSFATALAECAEYFEVSDCSLDRIVRTSFPNEPAVRKLVRCALLNLRSWNDATGVNEHIIHSFFNPSPKDCDFLSRTRECIKKSQQQLVGISDVDRQAYNAFICYYRQYGNLNDTKQFLPLVPRELDQLLLTSLYLAGVSNGALVQFSQGHILGNSEFPDVLLIIFIRGGFFRDRLLRENLYIQFGSPELLTPQTEQCVDATVYRLPCHANEREQLYGIFRNCLQGLTDTLSIVQRISRQLLGSNVSLSSGSSTKAPSEINCQAPYYNVGPR